MLCFSLLPPLPRSPSLSFSILGDRNTATDGQDRCFCRVTLAFRSRGFWEEGGTKPGPGMRRKRTRLLLLLLHIYRTASSKACANAKPGLEGSNHRTRNKSALLINLTGLNDPKNRRFHSDAACEPAVRAVPRGKPLDAVLFECFRVLQLKYTDSRIARLLYKFTQCAGSFDYFHWWLPPVVGQRKI